MHGRTKVRVCSGMKLCECVETLLEEIKKVWFSTADKETFGGLVYAFAEHANDITRVEQGTI
jgi:hypothetical protein